MGALTDLLKFLPSGLKANKVPTATVYESLDTSTTNEFWLLDSAKKLIAKLATTTYVDSAVAASSSGTAVASLQTQVTALNTEVTAARGNQSSLNTRLSNGLTPYGDSKYPYVNASGLREVRMRTRKRLFGETVQLVIAAIGDSYTQAASRYTQALATALQTAYGFAGIGWVSFGWYGTNSGTWAVGTQPTGMDGTCRSDLMSNPIIIGTWTCAYNNASANTPSISKVTSSTAGDYIAMTIPAGHNACRLFYSGDGTGVIAVSWDDGATYGSNISLSTVTAGNVLLTGIPATLCTARIKVVSGNVALGGVDLQSSTSGVRFHKLGGSGSSASQWAGVTQANWGAQMLVLGSQCHLIMLGTNDQAGAVSTANFVSQVGTMVTNLKSTLPYSDRLLVMPAENQRTTNAIAMPVYAQALREYALANDCAFIDMQSFFGSVANFAFEYAYANTARQWYSADLIHPDPQTGGRVMCDAIFRFMTAE